MKRTTLTLIALIAGGGKVTKVPDFTGGKWKANKPYFALKG